MYLVDTHAHLDDPSFAQDLESVIERAINAGVRTIVTVGTNAESNRAAIGLAERFENLLPVIGWHPSDALGAPPNFGDELEKLATLPKVVALGETGLDYHRMPSSRGGSSLDDKIYIEKQKELFAQHLEIASRLGLNVVIHQRDALEDTLEMIAPYSGRVRFVFHCFSGDYSQAKRILDIGGVLSLTGIVTFKNAVTLRETIRKVPLHSVMLETDCPYLAPEPVRGKRCEPAFLVYTARRVAEILQIPLSVLAERTTETAMLFFRRR